MEVEKLNQNVHYVNIGECFDNLAVDKGAAINYRDNYLLQAAREKKDIILEFEGVVQSPHSFLNALLSSVIQELGIQSYKKIKIKNAEPSIRETIDFILDDHTR